MSRAQPVAGYPSLSAAITALHAEGLGADDIVARLGCKRQTVHAQISILKKAERATDAWTPERLGKAHRIHEAALGVIAEAFGCSTAELRKVLRQAVPTSSPTAESAEASHQAPPTQEGPNPDWTVPAHVFEERHEEAEEIAPAGEADKQPTEGPAVSEKAAEVEPPAAAVRLYGFRGLDGRWLTKDGKDFTTRVTEAWSGDASQAKAARGRLINARYCKIRELE